MNKDNLYKNMIIDYKSNIKDALVSLEKSGQKICFVKGREGEILGSLSDGDIRKALLKGKMLDTSVLECANRNFIWVNRNESRMNVLDIMKARKINVLPILDGKRRIKGMHTLYGILGVEEKNNIAVIMAGGRGERLKPLTEKIPKPMLTVAGRPILERIIHHLVGFGIRKIYVSVNYLKEKIMDYFEDGARFGCNLEYVVESEPLGTAGSLSLIKVKTKQPIVVLNGDLVTQVNISDMIDYHNRMKSNLTVGAYNYVYQIPYGVLKLKRKKLYAVVEKPVSSCPVASGIYVVSPELIKLVPQKTFFTMPDLINKATEKKLNVLVYQIEEEWIDIGRQSELSKARGHYREKE